MPHNMYSFPFRAGTFPKEDLPDFIQDVTDLFDTYCFTIRSHGPGMHLTQSYRRDESGGKTFFKGHLYLDKQQNHAQRPTARVTIIPNGTHASARLDFQPGEGSWELIIPTDNFVNKYDEIGKKHSMQKDSAPASSSCPCLPEHPGPCAGTCPRYT